MRSLLGQLTALPNLHPALVYFPIAPVPWPAAAATLGVSAAGAHLKGLLEGRTVTHGHAGHRGRR